MDPVTGDPYAAPNDGVSDSEQMAAGILGMVVLFDPDTDEPYRLGA
ncbi:MAG: hypothetical protein WC322_02835 [Candidatus Paceibacterota bacterium]